MKQMKRFVFLTIFLILSLNLYAQETVSRIEIKGNDKVSTATVISKIKTRAFQPYNENVVNEDVKRLFSLGYFDDIDVETTSSAEGVVVTFIVTERPVLKDVIIEGERFIREKEILKTIELTEGSFVNEYKIKEAVKKLKNLYYRKGFSQADIFYAIDVDEEKNEADVRITINEERVLKVRGILIEGNKTFRDKRIIGLMKMKRATWWLFRRGIFKQELLEDDIKRIVDFYQIEGFSDVGVDYVTSAQEKGMYITITIEEGDRYYTGMVKVEGYEDISLDELETAMTLQEGDIFSQKRLDEEASLLQGLYMDRGYIFAQVRPFSFFNPQTQKVDVTFTIVENNIAYVERIDIRGNSRTKDKVIRRELRIFPGDKFEGQLIKKSRQRLENLGFFEDIRFDTEPGTKPDWQDLIVDVTEAKTGYLSFGGGYSSIDEFVGFVELRQRNFDFKNFKTFTGAGQDLTLFASFGTLTERYQLSFTNPWIFDRPVSFGFDAYQKGHKREEDVGYAYEESVTGGALRLGREFNDRIKGGAAYRLDRVEITDIVEDATQELKDEEGTNDLSSIELNASYDTRDNVFVPTRGIYFLNTAQFTGGLMGGDKDFTKYFSQVSFFVPMFNKSVVELKLRGGWADPFDDTAKVPIYERFFAGGAYTIRGYHERKVGPIDDVTEDPIGGESMFISNIEYTYPVIDFLKVATFFDSGNVWRKNSDFFSGGLKSSIGLGIRVKTPIGPVSVDYGWPLDTEPGEEGKAGRFHFSVSRGF